ncbi:hypothetical protein DMN91_006027 [Ooceraea biroi]|uniref:RNA helicase n=1 Tax=Ooceraea biroi TaxID=2015173 RepID=A0A026WRL3_OOCBI|nr:ATP-dependent RNA helicase DHX30 [Ooceraea biroi]EZA58331.1 Putative ATP-dependent RNA helicase DHX30 [Ooceraea biroi]RLU21652.1 hypothetical protein DMN91_006027 [Ooceraea biroi]
MSTTIFATQRVTHKWFHFCYGKFLYQQATTRLCVQSAAQYCISVKDKNKHISKDFEYEDITNKNDVYRDSRLKDVTEEVADNKGRKTDKFRGVQRFNTESLTLKKIERDYPQAKGSLKNIYALVSQEIKDHTSILTSSSKQVKRNWEITFNVKWPEAMSFTGISTNKTAASKQAALKCLLWLETNGKLRNGKPIIYSREEMKEKQLQPIKLSVTSDILDKMVDLIETYESEVENIVTSEEVATFHSSFKLSPLTPIHPILVRPETITDQCDKQTRNKMLQERLQKERPTNTSLPIFEFRDEILSKLQDNRVLLIEGDTGCGKTTQVPQFIIDSFAQTGNASDCNILVSQPRRISAITLADRIAYERNERVGDVVGFHVRLEQKLPRGFGGILFCTTGILLKKLQTNPGLLGCSHVILDEAHERHIDIDMLMILLKRALTLNPHLHVLVMSATINAHLFQRYFDCRSVKVPGRLHSVQMHFMEDIMRLPNIHKYQYGYTERRNYEGADKIRVDYEKVAQIIGWICENKPPGAILCFLPGWNEITNVQNILKHSLDSNQLILPIHSKMSHNEQRKIFESTPQNIRKIILATDIAETGITVSDVVYVVDSAIRKELRWDDNKDLPYISNHWVSQANIRQRKGRAGRVKPGESYHLITKERYKNLEPYALPQILCSPLEKVVLDSKVYTDSKAEEFLSGLIEPPSRTAIQKAARYLIDLGVLDDQENLTALGKRIAMFSTHPKISKALVYSTIFNCIHPVTTIAGIFSGEDNLFTGILDNKSVVRGNKRLFHPSSDHISLVWIFKQWLEYDGHDLQTVLTFCKQMKLRPARMGILKQIRDTLLQQLMQCHMFSDDMTCNTYKSFDELNKYEENDELVQALLYFATQQLIENKQMGFKNGVPRKMNHLQTHGRARAMISGESVNYNRKFWPSPFMTYLHSAHCETRRSTVIRESSMISPLSVLLFSQGETRCQELSDDNVKITLYANKRQTLRFSCNKETADVLLNFRDIMWSIVQFSLKRQGIIGYATDLDTQQVFQYKNKLLDTLSETLYEASKPIQEADCQKDDKKKSS